MSSLLKISRESMIIVTCPPNYSYDIVLSKMVNSVAHGVADDLNIE